MPHIGTLNENPLHSALKDWYAEPGDRLEVPVDGFVVDIVRGELLIEVQTANFSAIGRKLAGLAAAHRVRLVYPIPLQKWIVRLDADGSTLGRRRSPKRGAVEGVFQELVRIPHLPADPNFSLDVLLTREEEVRRHEEGRAWRRKGWVICERRLLEVAGAACSARRPTWPPCCRTSCRSPSPRPTSRTPAGSRAGWRRRWPTACARWGRYGRRGRGGTPLLYRRAG